MMRSSDHENPIEGNAPFGMSRFSIRRHSIRHFTLLLLVDVLLGILLAFTVLWGQHVVLVILSATTWAAILALTVLAARVGMRTIAVEGWIRRLGMGDFEYRIEPHGNDEIAKACRALETLRLRSIEVVRLQLVEQLGAELQTRNEELNLAMAQLREAQDQIVAQQKLREMVDLATGVAHEIRNPLNFVANFCDGSAELLDELMEALNQPERNDRDIQEISSELRANMDHIRRNVGRADRVLDGMINLSASHGAWQQVGLNLLVRQSVQAALDAYVAVHGGPAPEVEVQEDPAGPQCSAVPEGMALAIMSLTTNACEAVARAEGSMTPITVSVHADEAEARIIFQDHGCGMTPDVLEKAMTPFFTTKQGDHQGAGLGLPQAAEVARSHGGSVTLTSTPGRGSTATLRVLKQPNFSPGGDHQAS